MKTQSKAEENVHKFLIGKGFPPESIVYEPNVFVTKTGRQYIPDFAIFDTQNKEKLAYIEVKGSLTGITSAIFNKSAGLYRELAAVESIPFYVISCNDLNELKIYDFSTEDNSEKEVPIDLFPSYSALIAYKAVVRKGKASRDKKDTYDSLFIFCALMAIFLLSLLALDIGLADSGIKILTNERIVVVGIASGLIVLPFAQKLKGFGIEWERAMSKN